MTAADPGGFPLYDDPPEDPYAGSATEEAEPDTWAPVDLGPYLRGEVARPMPTLGVARRDGLRFLYPGKEHAALGEMEAGKSWFALACVAAELQAGQTVVYIHFEDADPSDTIERLQLLGVPTWMIATRLKFVAPERPVTPEKIASLLDPVPSIAILDGVNEGMSLHETKIRDEDGAAVFRRRLVKPFTRAGSAVLGLDHVVKDRDNRGRYAIGSVHKGNALNGVQIILENREPFGRGMRGLSAVYVAKDRSGHLRQSGDPSATPGKTYMGELIIDDRQIWTSELALLITAPKKDPTAVETPAEQDERKTKEQDEKVFATVQKIIADGKTANISRVRAAAKIANTKAADSLSRLELADRLSVEQDGRSKVYKPKVVTP